MEHTAVVQNDESLIKPVIERRGRVQRLLAPLLDGRPDRLGSRSRQDDSLFTNHPPDKDGIAMIRTNESMTPVIKIPELNTGTRIIPQHVLWEVGAF